MLHNRHSGRLAKHMRLRILCFLFMLGVCGHAAAGDLYAAVNQLRAGESGCAVAAHLIPLKPEPALARAAKDLAQGNQLQQSLTAAGYRATVSHALSIRGKGAGARAESILAERSYCEQLQDPAMKEIGIFLDANQVWIVMAAPFAPTVGISELAAGQRVLALVNQARSAPRQCGNRAFGAARPVRWNDTLALASRLHSEDMAHFNYFNHQGHDGSSPAQRVERAGYRYRATGENIAGGQMEPEEAMAGWIKSPGHCANLMNPVYTDMGAAFAVDRKSEMGVYWTQEFASPR
jgi:uncharacterized protein YkwD